MAEPLEYPIWMEGSFAKDSLVLLGARIDEGINRVGRIDIEFLRREGSFDLEDLVGSEISLHVKDPDDEDRVFPGICVAAEYVGGASGNDHFTAEIRPWYWLLSRTADSRVFQEINVPDLFSQILGEYGFSDLEKKLSGTYPVRQYLVQYRETDLDFLTRIAEEVGIYFFFVTKNGKVSMVLADNVGAHVAIPGDAKIPFRSREDANRLQLQHIHTWMGGRGTPSGRITLDAFDFTKPRADLSVASSMPKGKHAYKDYEVYDYPGKYTETSDGEQIAKIRMEAEAIHHHVVKAAGIVPRLAVGAKFTLIDHPRKAENAEYMVTRLVHQIRLTDYGGGFLGGLDLSGIEGGCSTSMALEAVPAAEQYRPRAVTPKPVIAGLQTAMVVGPSGEEIYTDEYGRVKVQFHWDREGGSDENASCWVRVAQSWAGKGFGSIMIPRIGWEVVVQFEEGDPDRPLITGALYNADNMPPYELPAHMTQTGLKTNSSKGGGGFNELLFEDKKDGEFVRFQSEKDYQQVVKNNASVYVGFEKKDKGDLTQMVYRNQTDITGEVRTHMTGLLEDLTVGMVYDEAVGLSKSQLIGVYKEEKVGIGKQDFKTPAGFAGLAVAVGGPFSTLYKGGKYADVGAAATAIASLVGALKQPGKKEEIHGVSELHVLGDRIQKIEKSSYKGPAKEGHWKTTVEDGDVEIIVKKGDFTRKINAGKVLEEAKTSIELKCGSSSIKMTPSKITISASDIVLDAKMNIKAKAGMNFKAEGGLNFEAKGGVAAKLNGSAMAEVKGGVVKIN